ncbi:hypothetical protein FV139_15190 [Parahaliea maris]|uniref:Alpha/beta hydrolase n=1 Tax=Parahaliea maris TaxID=2716870 RepID=A0A5C8ZUA0_9GAMM|nr:hypothetical protein [Parahaliea maris]TXS92068.1 hypothetical protein FV139_15190 [Parahaliea maris]
MSTLRDYLPLNWTTALYRCLAGGLVLALAACASLPSQQEVTSTEAVLPVPLVAGTAATDARAAFRQVFCPLALSERGSGGEGSCEQWLWRLEDEPAAGLPQSLPPLRPSLRVFVVGGAFSGCFGDASLAYRRGLQSLQQAGLPVRSIAIESRSGDQRNAELIARALQAQPPAPGQQTLLIGYSKGAVDILSFLATYPELAAAVDAVVSVAGPVQGSQVASRGAWAYDTFLASAFAGRCDPGDGLVVDSLLPETRQAWLEQHPLPAHIRYYSVVAVTTEEHIARGLRLSWQLLAGESRLNDGQLVPREGLIPGSALLAYANSDHWGVAIDIEDELTFFAARPDTTAFPRSILFEALLRYVGADLEPDHVSDFR